MNFEGVAFMYGTVPEKHKLKFEDMGSVLKKIRLSRGYTQKVLANMVEVNPNTISQIETGKTNLTFTIFYDICDALKVSPELVYKIRNDTTGKTVIITSDKLKNGTIVLSNRRERAPREKKSQK